MSLAQRIDARIRAIAEQAAVEMVAEIKDSLDAPYPRASVAGENPHKRSGDLQAGIDSEVTQQGPITTITVSSSAPYSRRLELDMGRPILLPALATWTPEIASRLTQAFTP